jgi:DNA invertase Pin-like site-specific DNA recombinase
MLVDEIISQSDHEYKMIGERTRDALAAKKARGERIGQIPFGYKVAADGIHLEKDAHETACVAIMIEKRKSGVSLRKLTAELNEQGWRNKSGKPWVVSQVHKTLRYHDPQITSRGKCSKKQFDLHAKFEQKFFEWTDHERKLDR